MDVDGSQITSMDVDGAGSTSTGASSGYGVQ
jgi:hypothetical protein